jgi:hypothetical protein
MVYRAATQTGHVAYAFENVIPRRTSRSMFGV